MKLPFATLAFLFLLNVSAQEVITHAGTPEVPGLRDGQRLEDALFNNPHGIALSPAGNIYLADRFNHVIRKISPEGIVSTIAGTGEIGKQDGNAAQATFYQPWNLAVDQNENVYVVDTRNNLIRLITPDGQVSTYAGSGSFGYKDSSNPLLATFGNPTGIVATTDGTLYIADHLTHVIRKISPDKVVSTLAGSKSNYPANYGTDDGIGANARFYRPYAICLDQNGDIIVADEWNHLIRRVTPSGIVTTVAGTGEIGSEDGTATQSQFNYPWGVTTDQQNNIYVTDGYNHVIRKISNNGIVSTFAGEAGTIGAQDGPLNEASFSGATDLVFDANSNTIFVSDAYNHLVRRITQVTGEGDGNGGGDNGDDNGVDSIQISLNTNQLCYRDTLIVSSSLASFAKADVFLDNTYFKSISSLPLILDDLPIGTHSLSIIFQAGSTQLPSKRVTFFVAPLPEEKIRILPTTIDALAPVVYFRDSSENIVSQLWEFGDPFSTTSNSSTEAICSHRYSQPWQYTIKHRITNQYGCTTTSSQLNLIRFLEEPVLPAFKLNQSDSLLCAGDSSILNLNRIDFDNAELFVNNELIGSTTSFPFYIYSLEPGDYKVYARISLSSFTTHTDTLNFTVRALPIPKMQWSDSLLNDNKQTVTFTNLTPNVAEVNWNFGNTSANGLTVQHTYTTPGVYSVEQTVTDQFACSATKYYPELITYENKTPELFISTDTICEGGSVKISSDIESFDRADIFLNDLFVSSITQLPYIDSSFNAGNYKIHLEFYNGDQKTSSTPSRFLVAPLPDIQFDALPVELDSGNNTVIFLDRTEDCQACLWDFGDPHAENGSTSSGRRVTHQYLYPGQYTVTQTVANSYGCWSSASYEHLINYPESETPDTSIHVLGKYPFIPSGFTPNGDGKNDVFRVLAPDIKQQEIMIFNQWGELIFSSNTPEDSWDGSTANGLAESATYTYLLRISYQNYPLTLYKGHITLFR